jgi:RHS repeat-associated protein
MGYLYDAANRRLREGTVIYNYYGLGGELLGQYEAKKDQNNSNKHLRRVDNSMRVWFAGRLVKAGSEAKYTDRMGSVVTQNGLRATYYPYGEEVAASTNDGREKFATYRRDATGLDYAWNRMYAPVYGRFLQADPYRASASMTNPQSWNRYAYVENDPVNHGDSRGLYTCRFEEGEDPYCDFDPGEVFNIIGWDVPMPVYTQAGESSVVVRDGILLAMSGMQRIAKGEFRNRTKCGEFFQALLDVTGRGGNASNLMNGAASTAGDAVHQVYDGPSSTVPLTADKFPGAGASGATTVGEWFRMYETAEALSQFNGSAVWIRVANWEPLVLGLGESSMGANGVISQYGLGILLHEILHKNSVGGGFTHDQFDAAFARIGLSRRDAAYGREAQSDLMGKICF